MPPVECGIEPDHQPVAEKIARELQTDRVGKRKERLDVFPRGFIAVHLGEGQKNQLFARSARADAQPVLFGTQFFNDFLKHPLSPFDYPRISL